MNKRIYFFFSVLVPILLCGLTFGQTRPSFLFYETHFFRSDSSNILFYIYKIPYNHFVFVKDGNKYTADFRLSIEVTDTLSNHITRQIDEKIVEADKFDETNSDKIYFEGLIKFNLALNKYHLLPMITDINSSRELKLPDVWVDMKSELSNNFFPPLIVQSDLWKCDDKPLLQLTNFGNCFPFGEEEYNLVIPCKDTSIAIINVVLMNNKDTVYIGKLNESFVAGIFPKECDNKIVLSSSRKISATRNFILKNFSHKLQEGNLRVFVSKDKNLKENHPFVRDVVWFNKPLSLRNIKEAIKMLKNIEKESVIDSLLSFDDSNYQEILFKYWKKFDQDTNSEFNPLMNEYYQRIDYTIKNFSTLSGKSGAATDRGETYIKYGKPKSIERASNEYGKIVEKWIYENPLRVFEFIDQNGAGDYILKK